MMALSGCTPLAMLNGLDRLTPSAEGARRVAEGVAYGSPERLKLDVYRPSRPAPGGAKLPVVLFFYGGGWSAGSRQDYAFAGAAFASQGFVAIVPDYRLVPEARFPTFIEDGARAVAWARANAERFGGDPDRITLAGHSAGAYIAAMLALDPAYLRQAGTPAGTVKAAALLAGPFDWAPFRDRSSVAAFGAWPRPAETQPISYVHRGGPPMLLATGDSDRTVWPRNSRRLFQRLSAAGVPSELKIYPRTGHADLVVSLSRPFRGRSPALADSAAFLKRWSEPRRD